MTVEPKTYGKADDLGVLSVVARYYEYASIVGISDLSVVPRDSFTSVDAVLACFQFCLNPLNSERRRAFVAAAERSFSQEQRVTPFFLTLSSRSEGVEGRLHLVFNPHGITTVSGKAPGYLLPSEEYARKFVQEIYGALIPFVGGFESLSQ